MHFARAILTARLLLNSVLRACVVVCVHAEWGGENYRWTILCSLEITAKYTETSAKTGYNIDPLFMMIAEEFVSITRQRVQASRGEQLRLRERKNGERVCLCVCAIYF